MNKFSTMAVLNIVMLYIHTSVFPPKCPTRNPATRAVTGFTVGHGLEMNKCPTLTLTRRHSRRGECGTLWQNGNRLTTTVCSQRRLGWRRRPGSRRDGGQRSLCSSCGGMTIRLILRNRVSSSDRHCSSIP